MPNAKCQLSNADWLDGLKPGLLMGAAVLVLAIPPVPPPRASVAVQGGHMAGQTSTGPASQWPPLAAAATPQPQLDLAGQVVSTDVLRLALWVLQSVDNRQRPFAVVDKKEARLLVFAASGRLLGSSAVLLGYAAGDDSVVGIGERPIAAVRPQERTTPAGRFDAEPGRNALGEQVLWVDYDAAVSMHRVRLSNPAEQRLARLDSPHAQARRISYGCINLPVAFFEQVLWPNLGAQRGVVYVLPEIKPLAEVFPALGQTAKPARTTQAARTARTARTAQASHLPQPG